ncbi:hypothetical protein [Desulforhopalus singaporensis]|uniref:Uncharacterized protein n=1 Tax=Desulforhopalus singaporensis TaxID=91360 RepID=A0A1H0LXT7_9BACT|nr:hypothetical protein [Desulforhopalus singaporensis]SDO72796.1 hypothetical protein SAMN05660330_00892 [Desulforhopalus singaporensis]
MDSLFIPQPDTIPVAWGWFQFLLLLTFPLHILAMNAMVGGLAIGVAQHLLGGRVRHQMAHRIAVALPLVIAFVVNFGVAPLLFLQVLYGQYAYSSSILMGSYWILVVPVLIIGYYGAYFYDFRFASLGSFGPLIGLVVLILLLSIGFMFSNNMLLMTLPERFSEYFSHRGGTLLSWRETEFWPRYLHMMTGAVAIGGIFVGLLGKIRKVDNEELAAHSEKLGLRIFALATVVNISIGTWYLFSLPEPQANFFMGASIGATCTLGIGIILGLAALSLAFAGKFWFTLGLAVALVVDMTLVRSWLRASYLENFFHPAQLQMVQQYSPLLFFLVILAIGLACIWWLLKEAWEAMS